MTQRWIIVGLGNPGPEYARTRHSIGHMVIDELAARTGATLSRHKSRNESAEVRFGIGGPRAVLAKPMSYMNTSGGPVAALLKYYDASPQALIVVHDELDVPYEALRLKRGGGEGGHNGLRDISRALGTRDYLRTRVGVGRPPGSMATADYVLRPFSSAEAAHLPLLIDRAADAVELLTSTDLTSAQNRVHAG